MDVTSKMKLPDYLSPGAVIDGGGHITFKWSDGKNLVKSFPDKFVAIEIACFVYDLHDRLYKFTYHVRVTDLNGYGDTHVRVTRQPPIVFGRVRMELRKQRLGVVALVAKCVNGLRRRRLESLERKKLGTANPNQRTPGGFGSASKDVSLFWNL